MSLTDEDQAEAWLHENFSDVPRETWDRLRLFEQFLQDESDRQNLVSRGTLDTFLLRHVVDSVQLLPLSRSEGTEWLDLGSGAGFPGLMVALFSSRHVTLVESRRLRIGFLEQAAQLLGLSARVQILGMPVERMSRRSYGIISARAFAPLPRLLSLAYPFSTEKTRWLLPKGRSAQSELEQVADAWQGKFRLVPSLTDEDARIVVAEGVRPRSTAQGQRRGT